MTAQTRVGSESGKTIQPTSLPVQNYAVIDLNTQLSSDFSDPQNFQLMSMDDNHNVAFGYLSAQDSSGMVVTFSNGNYGQVVASPAIVTDEYYERDYRFSGLLPDGRLIGNRHEKYNPDPVTYPGNYDVDQSLSTCFVSGQNITTVSSVMEWHYPHPVIAPTQTLAFANTGYAVAEGWSDDNNNSGEGSMLYGGNKPVFFGSLPPGQSLGDSYTVMTGANFIPVAVNDTGGAVGISPDGFDIWDGVKMWSTGINNARIFAYSDINDQSWVKIGDPETNSLDGALWHSGVMIKFADLLHGGPWEYQVQHVEPLLLSNQNTTDGSMYVVSQAQDSASTIPPQNNGCNEFVLWKGTQSTSGTGISWQPYRMQFPDGVTIGWYNFEAISSSGVIAAIADIDANAIQSSKLNDGAQTSASGILFSSPNGSPPSATTHGMIAIPITPVLAFNTSHPWATDDTARTAAASALGRNYVVGQITDDSNGGHPTKSLPYEYIYNISPDNSNATPASKASTDMAIYESNETIANYYAGTILKSTRQHTGTPAIYNPRGYFSYTSVLPRATPVMYAFDAPSTAVDIVQTNMKN